MLSSSRPTKEPPSHALAPPPSHKTTPPCLGPLHTTHALTVVSLAPEDEQLVVGQREAETIFGRRTRARNKVREVRPRVRRGVQHVKVVQEIITCKSRDERAMRREEPRTRRGDQEV